MTKLDQLMSKEMTRRQFLLTLGFGVASLFGLPALLGALTETSNSGGRPANDYGNGSYGH